MTTPARISRPGSWCIASAKPCWTKRRNCSAAPSKPTRRTSVPNITVELPHDVIRHKSEYVRYEGDLAVHTNSIEGYWAILKRGLYGVYQHVDAGYLGRYLDEFAYRFNSRDLTDAERFCLLLGQVQ